MFRMSLHFFQFLNRFLHQPTKVLIFCCALAFVNLVIDGSLLRLWSLYRDSHEISENILKIKTESKELAWKIRRASDPDFIEIEARNRFDLASEGDLIFIFSDEDR